MKVERDPPDPRIFLEEAQRLCQTGSFGWNPSTGETVP